MSSNAFARLIQSALASEDWMDWAACKGMTKPGEKNIFFPERGQPSREARAVCARCMVVEQCKDWADKLGCSDGVWAGELRGRDYIMSVKPLVPEIEEEDDPQDVERLQPASAGSLSSEICRRDDATSWPAEQLGSEPRDSVPYSA